MINIGTIYKITNPAGRVYIGQTQDLNKRVYQYSIGSCSNQRYLYNSIRKYGWSNHKMEIIYQGPITDLGLNQLEIHYIRIYNSYKGGLNLTEGGGGMRGYKASEETKAKQSAAHRGKKLSNEHKAKLSAAGRGRTLSQETKAKLSTANKGKKLSNEHKAKLSAAKKGKRRSEEVVAKKAASQMVAITQYDKQGNYIASWISIKDAASFLGMYSSSIVGCLKGRVRSAGGFSWRYS